jgi:hypothetical protein
MLQILSNISTPKTTMSETMTLEELFLVQYHGGVQRKVPAFCQQTIGLLTRGTLRGDAGYQAT